MDVDLETGPNIVIEDIAGSEIDWFTIEAGVRQGDRLSPLLFIILVGKCIRETNPQPNQQVLAYAHNASVMMDTIQELHDVATT